MTSELMYADHLPCTICLPNLVLVAQAVFLFEGGHTDTNIHKTQTPLITLLTYRLPLACYSLGPGWNSGESSRPWGQQLQRPDGHKCWARNAVLQAVDGIGRTQMPPSVSTSDWDTVAWQVRVNSCKRNAGGVWCLSVCLSEWLDFVSDLMLSENIQCCAWRSHWERNYVPWIQEGIYWRIRHWFLPVFTHAI